MGLYWAIPPNNFEKRKPCLLFGGEINCAPKMFLKRLVPNLPYQAKTFFVHGPLLGYSSRQFRETKTVLAVWRRNKLCSQNVFETISAKLAISGQNFFRTWAFIGLFLPTISRNENRACCLEAK